MPALLTIGRRHFTLSFTETEAKTHSDYELTEGDDNDAEGPVVSSPLPPHLLRPVTVVDSVGSGTGRKNRDLYTTVLKPLLDAALVEHDYFKTTDSKSLIRFGQELDLSKDHTLILLGGDTSAYELLNNLNKEYKGSTHDIDVCLVPMGSGNALAVSMGLEDEVTAIQSIFTAKEKSPLPLYSVEFPPGAHFAHGDEAPVKSLNFAIIFSFALHSKLVYYAEDPKLRGLGVERFKVAFGRALMEPQQFKFEFSADDARGKRVLGSQHAYVAVVASPYIEKGYLISPKSKLAHQGLHYLSFNDLPPEQLVPIIMAPYQGGMHIQDPRVKYESVDGEVTVLINEETVERTYACADGVIVVIEDPKGKTIKIKHVDSTHNHYRFNLVGLV